MRKVRISVILHSRCGNTFLIAKAIYESFLKRGNQVRLYRVPDADLEQVAGRFACAKEFYDDIVSLPVATPETMVESDCIALGSPTYFGNVSAEMKKYMDSAIELWVDAKLAGKKLMAFTSASSPEGGGHLCLQAINTFGQHLGMISVPCPASLRSEVCLPAYGIIHYSGPLGEQRPGKGLYEAIDSYSALYA